MIDHYCFRALFNSAMRIKCYHDELPTYRPASTGRRLTLWILYSKRIFAISWDPMRRGRDLNSLLFLIYRNYVVSHLLLHTDFDRILSNLSLLGFF